MDKLPRTNRRLEVEELIRKEMVKMLYIRNRLSDEQTENLLADITNLNKLYDSK